MMWFGARRDAPVESLCPRAAVPVHHPCVHCNEPFAPDDSGVLLNDDTAYHIACFASALGLDVPCGPGKVPL